MTYSTLQKDVEHIAKKAGKLLQSMQAKASIAVQKDSVDIATTADLAAEKLIISFIHEKYPNHGIYSEEMGKENTKSSYTWIIDPLDGSKEYLKGLQEYACLISVEKDTTLVGVSEFPVIGETYSSAAGAGAYLNGAKIHVSKTSTLPISTIGFHLPRQKNTKTAIHANIKILEAFIKNSYLVRGFNFDAKILGWVARGILDAHIIPSHLPQWYDVAPALLLVEEAGGRVTDWQGNLIQNRDLSHGIVASNGKVHDKILDIIKTAI